MQKNSVFCFFKSVISGDFLHHFFIIFSSLFDAIYTPAIYWCVKLIIDAISTENFHSYSQLKLPIILFVSLSFLDTLIRRFGEFSSLKSEPRVVKKIIKKAFDKVQSYRHSFFKENKTTIIITKIKGLIDGYENLLQDLKNGIFFNFLAVISHSLPIYFINHTIGGFLICWAVIFVSIMYFFSIKLHKISKDYNNTKHESLAFIADKIDNIQSIKSCEMEKEELQDLDQEIEKNLITKDIKLKKENLISGVLSGGLYLFVIVFVLFLSLEKKKNNEISIGDLTFIFTIIWDFLHHLKALAFQILNFWIKIGDIKSSIEIVDDTKNEENKDCAKLEIDTNNINLELSEIFYFRGGTKILENISLKIQHQEKIAILGFNGAGKSTLIKIILGIKDKTAGKISICGKEINHENIHQIRKMIGFVPQKIRLFHGKSILHNITYSILNLRKERVEEILKEIGINNVIAKLPKGLNSIVGVDINLSPGEEQQIFIARIILLNRPILILDEATSNTDAITEMYIQRALNRFTKDKMVISIAHRLNTIRHVDRIVVLHKGKIEQIGTHEDLMNEDGVYKQLLNCAACPVITI